MKSRKMRGTCPNCYRAMAKVTDWFGSDTPRHGDLALCKACGKTAVFDFSLPKNILRRPFDDEIPGIANNIRHQSLRALWLERQSH